MTVSSQRKPSNSFSGMPVYFPHWLLSQSHWPSGKSVQTRFGKRLGQRPPALLAGPHGDFGGLFFGHVTENEDHADRLALFILDQGGTVVDGPFATVPGDQERVRSPGRRPFRCQAVRQPDFRHLPASSRR